MKIVMIGAGNVATHLASALQNCGYNIVQVFSRTEASAKLLANKLQCSFTNSEDCIQQNADLYLYSVSDNALESVIRAFHYPKGIHIHTAGSIHMDIFRNYTENYGVLYPMQTFSKQKAVDFNSVPIFTEANNADNLEIINSIARKLSEKVYPISSEQRIKLHIAAVFACNFSNHCFRVAHEILEENQLPFYLMLPLIDETVEKLKHLTPEQAQTGPAVRNDQNVLEKHLKALENHPEKQELYRILSTSISDKNKNIEE